MAIKFGAHDAKDYGLRSVLGRIFVEEELTNKQKRQAYRNQPNNDLGQLWRLEVGPRSFTLRVEDCRLTVPIYLLFTNL